MPREEKTVREEISRLVHEFYQTKFGEQMREGSQTDVHYAGRVFDERELQSLISSSLDFWLTAGRFSEEFEAAFAKLVGTDYAFLVNSGSSANLVAFASLTSPLLRERALKPGDEVLTVAAGFPTTLNPVIQYGMIPVFVDIELPTYGVNVDELERAVGPKTRAIFLAHTLGNPFNLDVVLKLVEKHDLWLIEDCCDALGSKYAGKNVGTFGHIATCSFYPAHHITMGEGGAVLTNDDTLARAARSLRDWGRDCYCAGGENNTCGKRFSGAYGQLPSGYDHKYVYSHIGYNLKVTDMQAAIGVEQIKKLPDFVQARRDNFDTWQQGFEKWSDLFILPRATERSVPAWFAFPVTVRGGTGLRRTRLTSYLAEKGIETRNLFAGNLLKQPAYINVKRRIASDLAVTDQVMNDTFFLGTFPGLHAAQIRHALSIIEEFVSERSA